MLPIEIEPLFASAGIAPSSILQTSEDPAISSSSSADRVVKLMTEVRFFQEIISKFKELRVDPTEYTCLKAIVIFKTGKWPIKVAKQYIKVAKQYINWSLLFSS